MLSVNQGAYKLVQKLCSNPEEYKIKATKQESGATIIDAGIKTKGSFSAGRIITEITMGGLAKTRIQLNQYGDIQLPTITVQTDHPATATLAAQLAGWQIRKPEFSAIVSGPGRALALKPKEIYDKIGYKDKADNAVIVLETNTHPFEELIEELASQCKVKPSKFVAILSPTNSIVGSVQISGRVVETAVHKLMKLGLNPNSIEYACGSAPIAPVHPNLADAMGRTNDAILYGGIAYCAVRHKDDESLKAIIAKAPSKASKQYGKPFKEILSRASNAIYKIDPFLFAPAMLIVNNLETGAVHTAGEINIQLLKSSIGLARQ